eukprot:TRINITY_DN985_c3_g3_i1.p1 TRINITY_DN985_c3_g3~~TRINITY_DN985_c3_g3_i1.p1  ORF type:complete len:375 (+),score=77.95 TRINITY_DN985_c3_g3_i1:54-1178(+)
MDFWEDYSDITLKIRKKYVFKTTPFAEAKEEYTELLNSKAKKYGVEYTSITQLCLARCEEKMLNNKEISTKTRYKIGKNFSKLDKQIQPLLSLPSLNILSHSSLSLQSFLLTIQQYEKEGNFSLAASLYWEIGNIFANQENQECSYLYLNENNNGKWEEAAIYFQEAAICLLPYVLSTTSNSILPTNNRTSFSGIVLNTSMCPLAAFLSLLCSLSCYIYAKNYKKAINISKNMLTVVCILENHFEYIFKKKEHVLLTLFFLFTLLKDFKKSHKILEKLGSISNIISNTSESQTNNNNENEEYDDNNNNNISTQTEEDLSVLTCDTTDIIPCLFDFLIAFEEQDKEALYETLPELFLYLTPIQKQIIKFSIDQLL